MTLLEYFVEDLNKAMHSRDRERFMSMLNSMRDSFTDNTLKEVAKGFTGGRRPGSKQTAVIAIVDRYVEYITKTKRRKV